MDTNQARAASRVYQICFFDSIMNSESVTFFIKIDKKKILKMDNQVSFPALDAECSRFLSVGVPTKVFLPAEKKKIELCIQSIKRLKEKYEIKLKEPDPTPHYEPTKSKKYRKVILVLQSLIQEFSTTYFKFKQQIFARFWGIADQLLSVLEICYKNNVTCYCDVSLFQKFVYDEYSQGSPIRNYKWKLKSLKAQLEYYKKKEDSVKIPYWPVLLPKLAAQIQSFSSTANTDMGYAPPSKVDLSLEIVLDNPKSDINVKPAIENLKVNDTKGLSDLLQELTKRLGITKKKELIVLRCSVIRYAFDKIYTDIYKVFSSVKPNKFFSQCSLVGSFSPLALELSENPFTREQYKTAIQGLLAVPSIREINETVNWTVFYNNPIDTIADLALSLKQLGDFANENAKYRKLGRFASMADDVKPKKGEMMSFDDCFSLFFAAFVMNPPCAALSISKFVNSYDLGFSQQMNYARKLMAACIEHIMAFSPSDVNEFDESDPLGILPV
jgi:hypothetical protein